MSVQLFQTDETGAFSIDRGVFPDLEAAKAEAAKLNDAGEVGLLACDSETFLNDDGDPCSRVLWADAASESRFEIADALGVCPCGEAMPNQKHDTDTP